MEGIDIVDFCGNKIEVNEVVGMIQSFNGAVRMTKVKVEGMKDGKVVLSVRSGTGKQYTFFRDSGQVVKLYRKAA